MLRKARPKLLLLSPSAHSLLRLATSSSNDLSFSFIFVIFLDNVQGNHQMQCWHDATEKSLLEIETGCKLLEAKNSISFASKK